MRHVIVAESVALMGSRSIKSSRQVLHPEKSPSDVIEGDPDVCSGREWVQKI